jgi:hypothetical protein
VLNRAWPDEKDAEERIRLQGELRRINAIRNLKNRLYSDDVLAQKVKPMED